MKTYVKLLAPMIALALPLDSHASNLPKDFVYKGKPIDAICFDQLTDKQTPKISLTDCGMIKTPNRKIAGHNNVLIKKGYIGYDWVEPMEPGSSMQTHGYSYYKVLSRANDHYIIATINNGGGNGEFTSIDLVKRDGDNLEIQALTPAGDRCNGGISDAKEKQGKVTFAVNITAGDFLDLSNQNPHQLKAYDDLSACAACCEAKAYFEIDPKRSSKPRLVSVNFGTELIQPSKEAQGKYQFCFDTLAANYQKQRKYVLSPQQLNQFMRIFNTTCVKISGPSETN